MPGLYLSRPTHHNLTISTIAFDGPSPKTPYRRKNLAKISYASQVIANFVPNFVAMATGINRGKMPLAAFDGPSPNCILYTSDAADE